MLYTIYKITNNLNGKIYIGKHQTLDANDSYYGSGKAIVNAIKKHGKENFTKEILFIFQTEEEMNNKEKELITEEFVLREDTYNLGVGGEGGAHFKGKKHSEETISRIKESLNSDDVKQKLIDNGRRIGSQSKGRKLSEEARKNMSSPNKKPMSEETKSKISKSLSEFNKANPDHLKNKPKRKRKPLSAETKEKLKQRQLERWSKQKQFSNTPIA